MCGGVCSVEDDRVLGCVGSVWKCVCVVVVCGCCGGVVVCGEYIECVEVVVSVWRVWGGVRQVCVCGGVRRVCVEVLWRCVGAVVVCGGEVGWRVY